MRRREELHRIDGLPAHEDLEVQVWTRRESGRPHGGDRLADDHGITGAHENSPAVRVSRHYAPGVLDVDHQPVSEVPSHRADPSHGRRDDGSAGRRTDVDAPMRAEELQQRMHGATARTCS